MGESINAITISIDRDLWEDFKVIIPRTITLNDAVVALIKREVDKGKIKK